MIDALSGGRLEIGLGRHGELEANSKAIDLVNALLHHEDVPMPASEGLLALSWFVKPDQMTKMTLWPRSYGTRLPLWAAAGSEGSVIAAAKRGLGLFTGLTTAPETGGMATGTIDGLEPLISRYIEVGQEHGHNLSLSNVAVISFTVVGDTDEKAEARAMAGLKNHFEKATATYTRVTGTMRGDPEATAARARSFVRSPFALIGSLKTVREKLERLRSVGLSRFIAAVGLGLDHQEAWESACALAEDVAPDAFAAQRAVLAPFGSPEQEEAAS
jgi:alkanesulfonate monooxygenase SsuD/methylene tetrahydromethanopterin reductase-like flavin-dependent oxidoreductase (luciferase family)